MVYVTWLRQRADELRANMTPSENIINKLLLKLKIRFKAQVPIMTTEDIGYIADFLLFNKYILEIDGDTHKSKESKMYDQRRTVLLQAKGYKVYRVSNNTVHNRAELIKTLIHIMNEIDTDEARYCIYRLKQQPLTKGKKKSQKKNVKKTMYKYDPDFKSKLYAINGW